MFNLTISTIIEAPIKHVFDYMSMPENDLQWQYGTLATAIIASRYNKIGVYYRSIGHLMGHRNLVTYEVVEYISNMQYKFKSLSGPLNLLTTYIFESVGNGTKVTISIHVDAADFFHVDEKILGITMKQQLRENLAVLKNLLEVKRLPYQTRNVGVVNT